jgi:glycosyltransferase involved in cell wall biosynthesis
MSDHPVVSVVVIFLNAEKFIGEAIESVYAQSYENWELLLVDDGSTDGSTDIALRYAERRPEKVRYLEHDNHQNRGMSATRNLGIRHARGRYIALLDADDVWLPDKLKQQVAILDEEAEAALVYGASEYWRSWTGNPQDSQSDSTPPLGIAPGTLVRPPTLLIRSLDATARTPCPSDWLVRREVVQRVGGFEEHFRGAYQLYEDQAFLAKVYLTVPVFVAGMCWDKYRQHPDSCVSVVKKTGHKYSAGLYYLKWLAAYLLEEKINDPGIWKALRRKRRRYRLPRLYRMLEGAHHRVRQMKRLPHRVARKALPALVYRWFRAL